MLFYLDQTQLMVFFSALNKLQTVQNAVLQVLTVAVRTKCIKPHYLLSFLEYTAHFVKSLRELPPEYITSVFIGSIRLV